MTTRTEKGEDLWYGLCPSDAGFTYTLHEGVVVKILIEFHWT